MPNLTERVRRQIWLYLSPDVAVVAGMTVDQLQRFISGTFTPTPEQIEQLARRMGVTYEH